jgi:hypothetical protein
VAASGDGVTFFNTYPAGQPNKYGSIDITSSSNVVLKPPSSGTYAGLLFYNDPTVDWAPKNGSTFTGGSASVFQGILYFPSTDLKYAGNSANTGQTGSAVGAGFTILIAYNLEILGGSQINTDYSDFPGGRSPLQIAVFAE